MVAQNIAFGVMVGIMGLSAIRVVTTRNVVHAALYLMVVLATVAGLFLLLGAEFLGITQVLIYIGAVIVLFLFGIMLTGARIGKEKLLSHRNKVPALMIATVITAVSIYAAIDYFGADKLPEETRTSTKEVANSLFSQYIIPFEVASVLLLAALIGAIVIARREPHEENLTK